MKLNFLHLLSGILAILPLSLTSNVSFAAKAPHNFKSDKEFLLKHTDALVLSSEGDNSQLIVVPEYQGRVMTSSAQGDEGLSFGWLNYDLIASKKFVAHMNAFGGEDRFWMGPEGGQFALYFAPDKKFDVDNWQVPKVFDTDKYRITSQTKNSVIFNKRFQIQNYAKTNFDVNLIRKITVLNGKETKKILGVDIPKTVQVVAYVTDNQVTNLGKMAWDKKGGLLSIWILGNYAPSSGATVILPINKGSERDLGPKVQVYKSFGEIPESRLKVKDEVVFFKADGEKRAKIGLTPQRAKDVLGSYDATKKVLTIVKYNKPQDLDYVNSNWEIQKQPYAGDVVNSYNDGPLGGGLKQLGPFYELETSSPALALAPGKSYTHSRYTFHFVGSEQDLDRLAKAILGVGVKP